MPTAEKLAMLPAPRRIGSAPGGCPAGVDRRQTRNGAELDAGELIGQPLDRGDQPIDAALNVAREHAVPIAVHIQRVAVAAVRLSA